MSKFNPNAPFSLSFNRIVSILFVIFTSRFRKMAENLTNLAENLKQVRFRAIHETHSPSLHILNAVGR